MVSVACFGVKISVMFHLMFVHNTFSSVLVVGHLLGNSCPLGLQSVLIVLFIYVIYIYFLTWFLELDLAFDSSSSCSMLFYYFFKIISSTSSVEISKNINVCFKPEDQWSCKR